ncbi:MAG: flippase-like domain-containing protein [Actinobacteria bacterium]|nr:flippase-like domain-containing protein [Actinomycetota bacterium]
MGSSGAADGTTRRRGSRALLQLGRAAFLLAALGLLARQVARDGDGVGRALQQLDLAHAALSLVAAIVGLGASGLAWRALLAAQGYVLPVAAVPPVFFVAQIGKYLPGAVWPYLAQVRLGRRYGVSASRSAVTSVLFVLAHCASGGAIAAAVLPWVSPAVTHRFWWALVFAPLLLLLLLHPRVLLPLLGRVHRLARRGVAPQQLAGRRVATALGWLLVAWACYGASLLALLGPLTTRSVLSQAALSLGAYALAWTVGFAAAAVLVIAAPAGLGFREVVLVALLAPVSSTGAATAVALLSRLAQTLGDALWALAGVLLAARSGQAVAEPGADPAVADPVVDPAVASSG